MNDSRVRVTNDVFAERTGCDFTTASRLRNGNRMPSAALLVRIVRAFDLDMARTMEAYEAGPKDFSAYLRENVFDPAESENDVEDSDSAQPPKSA